MVLKKLLSQKDKLHLGCGGKRLANFLNVDFRATEATDITHDCANLNIFPTESFSTVYSSAFFEHLYRGQREKCLQEVWRVLKPKGTLVFVNIPNFKRVALAYLNNEPGLIGEKFDLYHVYRFTHGDPEQFPDWWLQQLHKSLFDEKVIEELLIEAGFKSFCIFSHCFQDEKIPVNIGFVGFKDSEEGRNMTKEKLGKFLSSYTSDIKPETIKILSFL